MLDFDMGLEYTNYAVKYGLMPEVTLVTGNQRELRRTSSRHDRERADLKPHFLLLSSMKHTASLSRVSKAVAIRQF